MAEKPVNANPNAAGGEGRTPRLTVTESRFSAGFWANLRDFLTERPVKVPRDAAGSFGHLAYGAGLVENLKEFFRPAPRGAGGRLLNARLEVEVKPWYVTLFGNLRDALFPKKLPPLKVTSQPVKVREIWSRDENFSRSQAMSLTMHAVLIVLIALPIFHEVAMPAAKTQTQAIQIDLSPYMSQLPPGKDKAGGGGGGGERNPIQATRGRLPKFSMQQLSPPALVRNPDPKLAVEPTVIVPPDIRVPNPALPNYGDPLSALLTDSQGPGSGGGFGTGSGGGVGSGSGPGVGPGWGGGIGGGAFRPGTGGVGEPGCVYCPEPQFSEEARKAKHQGVVVLRVIITPEGKATNISVVRGLGLGLDEKAIEAVQNWRFRPANGPGGKPVPVWTMIEVTFRLL